MTNKYVKKPVCVGMVTLLLALAGCGGSHEAPAGGTAVDRAIALYIEGAYVQAARDLNRLTTKLEADEERRTAYLYLGRTYVAMEDYDRAVEAFTTGKLLGGGVRFDEYLLQAQRYVGASPATVRAQSTVTRDQLAALIHSSFEDNLQEDVSSGSVVGARTTYLRTVTEWGVMDVLADGEFHGDREVTRSAFYFVLLRLAARLEVSDELVASALYPQGLRSAVAGQENRGGAQFITGSEAADALLALVSASNPGKER